MKRRHPLATLVKLASLRERRARTDVGIAQKDVDEKARSLEARRHELLTMLQDDRPLPVHLAAAMRLQGLATAELIELAANELDASERRLWNNRRKWQDAAHDLEIKEELELKKRREHALLAAKAAERVLDELMAARHKGTNP
jgi:flagellar biosynthesis chaperone FliJ